MSSEKAEGKELFSQRLVAGKRTYFFDVKESREGVKFLVIAESRLVGEKRERSSIMIFQEHLAAFLAALQEILEIAGFRFKTYDLQTIRQHYPKAYAKWAEEEDKRLTEEYQGGKTIEELAKAFQRKPSAIRARLRKLGLLKE